jgi:hypothetical protein
MRLINNYQNMMDNRLSKPKSTQKVVVDRIFGGQERVYRNSALKEQKIHESVFNSSKTKWRGDMTPEDELFRRTFDDRIVQQLQSVFSSNHRQYNES